MPGIRWIFATHPVHSNTSAPRMSISWNTCRVPEARWHLCADHRVALRTDPAGAAQLLLLAGPPGRLGNAFGPRHEPGVRCAAEAAHAQCTDGMESGSPPRNSGSPRSSRGGRAFCFRRRSWSCEKLARPCARRCSATRKRSNGCMPNCSGRTGICGVIPTRVVPDSLVGILRVAEI